MKNFRIAVMLNGAEAIDWYEQFSNLWKMKSGLVTDASQAVLYYNLGTVNSGQFTLWRLIKHATGHAYASLLDRVYSDLLTKIRTAINNNEIHNNDNVIISLFGFNDGASLARHFGIAYIKNKLINDLPSDLKALGLKIKLDAEYLFDSVCLPPPATVSVLSRFAMFSFEPPTPYYQSDIPSGTKCVHLVSLDEFNKLNTPLLVNRTNDDIEEIWVSGDSLDDGGGYLAPADGLPTAADDAMRHMVMRSTENGLRFSPTFLQQLENSKETKSISPIHDASRNEVPRSLRQVRSVYVQQGGHVSDEMPVVHESVLHRMKYARHPYYDPPALLPFKELEVVLRNGERASARFEDKAVTPITPRLQQHKLNASQEVKAAKESTASNGTLRRSLSKIAVY